MARRKKKVNRKLLFVLSGIVAVMVLGAAAFYAKGHIRRDPVPFFNEAEKLAAEKNWDDAAHSFQRAVMHSRRDQELNIKYRMAFAKFLLQRLEDEPSLSKVEGQSIGAARYKHIQAVLNVAPNHPEARRIWTEYHWRVAQINSDRPTLWLLFIKSADMQLRQTPDDVALLVRCTQAHAALAVSDRKYYRDAIMAYVSLVAADRSRTASYYDWASFVLQQKRNEGAPNQLGARGAATAVMVFEAIDKVAEAKRAKTEVRRRTESLLESLTPVDLYALGVDANPLSVPLRVEFALFLRSHGDEEAGKAEFAKALAISDTDAEGLLAIGRYYLSVNEGVGDQRFAEALGYLREANRSDPSLIEVYNYMGWAFRMRREFELSQKAYRDGLKVLDEGLAGGKPEDLGPIDRQEYFASMISLQAGLSQALADNLSTDAERRAEEVAAIGECLAFLRAYVSNIEDRKLDPPRLAMQLGITRVRGRVAMVNGDVFEAQRLYRAAYDASPRLDISSAQALVGLHIRHGEETEAERILTRISTVHPSNVKSLIMQAQLQLGRIDDMRAEDTLQRLATLSLNDAQTALVAGMREQILRIRGAKIPEATLPINVDAAEVPRWLVYIQRLLDNREVEQAAEVAEALREQFPANEQIVDVLVRLYQSSNHPDRALAVVADALKVSPDSQRLTYLKEMLSAPPQDQEEIDLKYISEHQEGAQREMSLARFYSRKDDRAKYLDHLHRAVEIDPSAGQSLNMLFSEYLRDANLQAASALADKAAELNLQGVEGRVYKARLLMQDSKWDEAAVLVREALALRPQFSDGHALLGKIQLIRGELEEAGKSLGQAYEQNRRNIDALTALARLAEVQGRTEDHEMWVYRAYAHTPFVPYIRHAWLRYQQQKVSPREFLSNCVSMYKRYRSDMEVVRLLAQAYERLDPPLWDKAEQVYRQVYDLQKDSADAMRYLQSLVLFLQRAGKVDQAGALLEETTPASDHRIGYSLIRAQFFTANGRHDEARKMIDEAIKLDPNDVRGRLFLAKWAVDVKRDWPAAVDAIERVVELEPDSAEHWNQYIQLMLRAKMYEKAGEKVAQRMEADPRDAAAMAMRGQIYFLQKRPDEALKMCDRALRVDVAQVHALMLRADIYLAKGLPNDSIRDLEAAYKLRPSPQLAILVAQRHIEAKEDWNRSREILTDALSKYSKSIELLRALANVSVQTRNWRELTAINARGRKLNPRLPDWSEFEARMWKIEGDLEKQTAALQAAHTLAPADIRLTLEFLDALLGVGRYSDALALVARTPNPPPGPRIKLAAGAGRAHIGMGDETQGLRDFQMAFNACRGGAVTREVTLYLIEAVGQQRALELMGQWINAKENPSMRLVLGRQLASMGDPQLAEEILAGADYELATEQVQFELFRQLGLVRNVQGRIDTAKEAYEKALALNGADVTTLNNLAYLLAEKLGRPGAAVVYAEKASALQPTSANVADTLGWIYFQVGQLDKAQKQLEHSLQLGTTTAALYHLGRVFDKQGQPDKAKTVYKRGYDLVRDNSRDPFYKDLNKATGR